MQHSSNHFSFISEHFTLMIFINSLLLIIARDDFINYHCRRCISKLSNEVNSLLCDIWKSLKIQSNQCVYCDHYFSCRALTILFRLMSNANNKCAPFLYNLIILLLTPAVQTSQTLPIILMRLFLKFFSFKLILSRSNNAKPNHVINSILHIAIKWYHQIANCNEVWYD